jgi:hypothetical protein
MKTFKEYVDTKVSYGKRPMMVFRGVGNTIEERHPSSLLGIFASPDINTAKAYAGQAGKILKLYMNIKNPYYMSYEEIQNIKNEYDALRIKSNLKRLGYDGIFLKPIKGSGANPYSISEYIAFDKSQLKEI